MLDSHNLSLDGLTLEELERLTSPSSQQPPSPSLPSQKKASRSRKKAPPPPVIHGLESGAASSDVPPVNEDDNPSGRKFNASEKKLIEEVFGIYMMVSLVLMPINMNDAMLFSQQAQACAEAHILLARQHKSYMKFLKRLTTVNAYGAMISAHMPIVMGLLMQHKLLPDIKSLFTQPTDEGDNASASSEQPPSPNPFAGLVYRPV